MGYTLTSDLMPCARGGTNCYIMYDMATVSTPAVSPAGGVLTCMGSGANAWVPAKMRAAEGGLGACHHRDDPIGSPMAMAMLPSQCTETTLHARVLSAHFKFVLSCWVIRRG